MALHGAPDMRPFYEGVRLASLHLHDPARGRFHDALVAINKVRITDASLDEQYRYDILPLHLVELFDTFNLLQNMLWDNRPWRQPPEGHNLFREEGLLQQMSLVLGNQVINVHKAPVMTLSADTQREARRLNGYAYMLLGRTATAAAMLGYVWGGRTADAEVAGHLADIRYGAVDTLFAADGDQQPFRMMNALYAARSSRILQEGLTPQVEHWLGRAAASASAGGDREVWLPRTIYEADSTGSREAAFASIFDRP